MTTGGEIATLVNGFTITAGTPVITTVSPNSGRRSANKFVGDDDRQLHDFLQGTGGTFPAGVTVSSLTVNSATSATAIISISSTAATGAGNVTMTTGGEIATLVNGFTITGGIPVLSVVSPNSGQQGATNLSVTITGNYTHFLQGTTAAISLRASQ